MSYVSWACPDCRGGTKMARNFTFIASLVVAGSAFAADFTDDFTNNTYTQANWVFASPFNCLSPAFTASGTASAGNLCMSTPTPGSAIGQSTIIFGYETQAFPGNDVAVYAGVSFTSDELT